MTRFALAPWLGVACLLLAPACSDDGPTDTNGTTESGDGDPGDGDPGDGDPGDGDPGDGDPGDGDPGDGDPGDGDPGDGDPGDGDPGDGDGDPGDGDGDPGDGDGDPGDPITYSALNQPGGLDRVFIDRHDPNTDTCTRIVMVWPGQLMNFNVTTPMEWSIESVNNYQGADCVNLGAPDPIDTGTGDIAYTTLDGNNHFPCTIDVDVTFDVMGNPPTLDFVVVDLDVPNC